MYQGVSQSLLAMTGNCCPVASNLPLTACVVVDTSLGKHGVVLNLRLANWGAVAADDHQLGCEMQSTARHAEQSAAMHNTAYMQTACETSCVYFTRSE
jgi:hypothetical protein